MTECMEGQRDGRDMGEAEGEEGREGDVSKRRDTSGSP